MSEEKDRYGEKARDQKIVDLEARVAELEGQRATRDHRLRRHQEWYRLAVAKHPDLVGFTGIGLIGDEVLPHGPAAPDEPAPPPAKTQPAAEGALPASSPRTRLNGLSMRLRCIRDPVWAANHIITLESRVADLKQRLAGTVDAGLTSSQNKDLYRYLTGQPEEET